jgi:hypothetical protein
MNIDMKVFMPAFDFDRRRLELRPANAAVAARIAAAAAGVIACC